MSTYRAVCSGGMLRCDKGVIAVGHCDMLGSHHKT